MTIPSTVDEKILEALSARLATLVLPGSPPVSWPFRGDFDPPEDGKYLVVQFIPNGTNRFLLTTGGPHQYLGMLQVTVHWPDDGEGLLAPRSIAGLIADHFPEDEPRHVYDGIEVRITSRPDVAETTQTQRGNQTPVTIPYECFA